MSAITISTAADGASPWLEVFGRLHPLLVHLPIGLLTALAALETVALLRARSGTTSAEPRARAAQSLIATFAAAAAVVTALAGWRYGHDDGRTGSTFELHQRLGIAVAVGSVALAVAHAASRGGARTLALATYRVLLAVTLALLVPAGHLGATMTHGEGFLTEPLTRAGMRSVDPAGAADAGTRPSNGSAARGAASPDDPAAGGTVANESASSAPVADGANGANGAPDVPSSVFERHVLPVFVARCSACHGGTRKKGGLALDTRAAIEAGARGQPVIVAGDPGASEIVRRLRLPLDDEDHMPPREKPQPTAEEIALIEAWIAAGAPFEGAPAELEAVARDVPAPPAPVEALPGDAPRGEATDDAPDDEDDDEDSRGRGRGRGRGRSDDRRDGR